MVPLPTGEVPPPHTEAPLPPTAGIPWPELQRQLMRAARQRVRHPTLAEDAVAATLLAAVEAGRRGGSGAPRSAAWCYGVLQHKLVDELRRHGRELPGGERDGRDEQADPRASDGEGLWQAPRGADEEPERAILRRELGRALARGLGRLPPVQAQAFVMREVQGLEAAAICQRLGVTTGHLWVLLYRARRRLRELLAQQGLAPHA